MGFTIEDALRESKKRYKMTLLAGEEGCSNAMSWIQMVEDKTILQQLWGKELVVTTGLGFQSQEKLREFIEQLIKYHSVGLVINTGKYIFDIDQDIIDYCDELSFPLLTVPWEIHIADMIKDFSYHCLRAERDDKYINQTVMDTLINPAIIEESRNKLAGDFDVENDFQVMAISVETEEELGMMERRSIKFQLELCFEKVEGNYSFFWFDGYYIMIFNNLEDSALVEVINEMYKRAKKRLHYTLHLGIGSKMADFRNIILSYKRAIAACKMAKQFNYPQIYFDDMGVYQLLFIIEDQGVLKQMYRSMLGVLIDYDQKHNTQLEETLYQYLKFDSNQKAMAESLFMHRNTINYRLNKIKELTECQLDSFEEKMPYMLAFYIKEIVEKKEK